MKRAIAIGIATLAVGYSTAPIHAQSGEASCQELTIAVTLVGQESLYGKLCVPSGGTRTALLLVPGGSYTSEYWDLPSELGLRSFRASLNGAGYATLMVDRLGSGRSSRPLSTLVTTLTQAAVMHQAIQQLRAGSFGPGFDKVIIGGHSLGGAISLIEAATYHDVDALLLAGITHHIDLVDATTNVLTQIYPAALDPALASRGLDPGYVTTRPGARLRAWHLPGTPTPSALNHDEATKDVFSLTEAADGIGVASISPYSLLVDAPVLLSLSSRDELFCGPLLATNCSSAQTLRQQEAPYFSAAAHLETYLFPGGYGHSFNYAPNADEFYQTVAGWADRMVGR